MALRATAKRVALREYLPFAGWIAAWALIGLAVGHADAVRLLAANTFVMAIRSFATLELMAPLGRRSHGEASLFRRSRQAAVRIDIAALGISLVLVAMVAAFLWSRSMADAALMVGIVAAGLPARHPLALFVAQRNRDIPWRSGVAIAGVVAAGAVFLLGLDWRWAAAALALREWGGLVATALTAGPRRIPANLPTERLSFAEAAAQTESAARRRLTYRMAKSLLMVMFGPFGGFAARTGRGAKLDSRITRWIPRSRVGLALLTAGSLGTALFWLVVAREPATLLLGAAFARIAASSGAALLWWRYGSDRIDDEDDDD